MSVESDEAPTRLRLALAQLNLLVGDVGGNLARVVDAGERARDELGAQVVVFPELTLTGYPPEDLLLRPGLVRRTGRAMDELARGLWGIHVIVGHPELREGKLYNAASVLYNGQVLGTYHKQHLPNYRVFDEKRYFVPGSASCVVPVHGVPVGLTICEDVWQPGPVAQSVAEEAAFLVNINASPYRLGKSLEREEIVRRRALEARVPIAYANLVGGQDELVFDGGSFVMDAQGVLTQHAPLFQEGLYAVDIEVHEGKARPLPGAVAPPLSPEESAYEALVLGIRDYIEKNRFAGVVIGLSGGIDSALTLALAVDALGPDRVEAVMMPSRYTASMSLEDARTQAETLGVRYRVLPIEPAFNAFLNLLGPVFEGMPRDTTEENIQARCRGVLLMAISNKLRTLVLTTGNKSEMAVGYATLYGDMAGGFAAIKDVPKTLVYRLAAHRNRQSPVIPQRVLDRPPSAELAPDQKDQDSLPPYEVLDPILEMYIEQDRSPAEIVAADFDQDIVRRVVSMVDRNEYKRRQAPPGVRITRRAFGRDRRYPLTSGYNRADDWAEG